jgi:hypothetical protein
VIDLVSEVMPFVATFQIADGLAQANGGCLRGMGRQHIGACVNLIAYYAMALPCGIYLAFHGWGLAGLWAGNSGGMRSLRNDVNSSSVYRRVLRMGPCLLNELAEAGEDRICKVYRPHVPQVDY